MSTPLRLGLVAAAVIIAAVGGIYLFAGRSNTNVAASPSPTATAVPSPTPAASSSPAASPAMAEFLSPLYNYHVQAPSAYQFVPATQLWPAGEALGPEAEWTDRFRAGTSFVGIASQQLPEGMSSDDWLAAYAESVENRECGGPASAWTDTTIDGAPGRKLMFDCGGDAGVDYAWVI